MGNPAATQSLDCADVGAGSVVLTMTSPTLGTINNTFPCYSFQGSSQMVPAGTYDVSVSLYGDPAIYGKSHVLLDTMLSPAQTILAGTNGLAPVNFLANAFVLSWTISRGGGGASCEAVRAARVELDVTFAGEAQPTVYYFDCANSNLGTGGLYSSITLAIPFANPAYEVKWQAFLLDAAGWKLTPGTTLQNFSVTANAQADLGTVHFTMQ